MLRAVTAYTESLLVPRSPSPAEEGNVSLINRGWRPVSDRSSSLETRSGPLRGTNNGTHTTGRRRRRRKIAAECGKKQPGEEKKRARHRPRSAVGGPLGWEHVRRALSPSFEQAAIPRRCRTCAVQAGVAVITTHRSGTTPRANSTSHGTWPLPLSSPCPLRHSSAEVEAKYTNKS